MKGLLENSELCQMDNVIEQSQKKTKKLLANYINIMFRQSCLVNLALEDTDIYFS